MDYYQRHRITAEREPWARSISLRFGIETEKGLRIAKPVELVDHDERNIVPPLLNLPVQAAQELMDELWRCGLRPTEGTGSAGALAATERHLQDMRSLVFKIKPQS
ncbi:hypothetical protein [Burkholderia phage CSP3]|nr:hypothetical protein [Burkholderia phage CSP3]